MTKISEFITKYQKNSVTIIRIGLALVLLWFGVDEILNTQNWLGYVPAWLNSIIPFSVETFIVVNGVFEILIGALLLIGYYTRIIAFIAALHLLSITLSVGYNDIAVRDFGLTLMAVSLIFSGSGSFSFRKL
jgi:uncharacterized membrane protein YphA (DoxX/SURF4 family)